MLNGEEMKRIRMIQGISQSQLANTLGMRNREIIAIESGDKNPDKDLYFKWMNALYDEETKNASKKKVTCNADVNKAAPKKRRTTTKKTDV